MITRFLRSILRTQRPVPASYPNQTMLDRIDAYYASERDEEPLPRVAPSRRGTPAPPAPGPPSASGR